MSGQGRRLAAACALAALAAVTPALPAAAVGTSGNGAFGLAPAPGSDGRAAPYFSMTVAAGDSATGTAIISNLGQTTERLKVSRSTGQTAANSGSAFSRYFQDCADAGCWVTGLPAAVTLRAASAQGLPFTVTVPAGPAPGQYLAGITAESAAKPQPVRVGSNGKATAGAIIVQQVTVGVAVTVGSLSRLTMRLRIPGVSGGVVGPVARLNIGLDNRGQTFAHATGTASCTAAGKRHSFAVFASTILPHDHAVIAVNAPGLPKGVALPCTVRLSYGDGLTVSWSGMVTVPSPPRGRIIHTGPGAYSVVPPAGLPLWAIALLVVGVAALAAMAVLLRRARRRNLMS
jgi:hypothetical protein